MDNCVNAATGNGFLEIPNVRLTVNANDIAGGIYCGTALSIPLAIPAITISAGVVSKYIYESFCR